MVGPCVGGRHLGGLVTTLCRTAKRVLATRECAPTQHTERTCLRVGGERDKLPLARRQGGGRGAAQAAWLLECGMYA